MLLIVGLYATILPIVLLIIWKIKTKCNVKPFVVGALIFFVFAQLLEGSLHNIILLNNNPLGNMINKSIPLYVLYAALAAGIFEEVGRLIGFKFLLKNHDDKETSIMYGIGHGGFEAIMLIGINFILFWLVSKGMMKLDAESNATIIASIQTINWSTCLAVILERSYAIMMQIALSIIVFISVHKKKWSLFFLAILLHALIDVPAALFQKGVVSMLPTELITLLLAISLILYALKLYKNYVNEDEDL